VNLALYPTLTRTAPDTSHELELEVHIANQLTARDQLRSATLTYQRAVLSIQSTLGFLDGYDRAEILRLTDDWLPPDDAAVERWAADNFVSGEE